MIGQLTLRSSVITPSETALVCSLQSGHFLDYGLKPGLDEGILIGDVIDGRLRSSQIIQIGLMKHESIMMETKEMTSLRCFLNGQ